MLSRSATLKAPASEAGAGWTAVGPAGPALGSIAKSSALAGVAPSATRRERRSSAA